MTAAPHHARFFAESSGQSKLQLLFCAASLVALGGCEDFFTQDVEFGGPKVASSSSTSSGAASSTTSNSSADDSDGLVGPADDDGDGLSNSVETTAGIGTKNGDTDLDGFSDGLEFVGLRGEPLNGSIVPTSFRRVSILDAAAAADPADGDSDGLGDGLELDRALDPESPDSDEDGYADGLELVAQSDPLDSADRPVRSALPEGTAPPGEAPADRDGDGLSDDRETVLTTNSSLTDTDADGASDGLEYLMGSDPTSALSVPKFPVSGSAGSQGSSG